MFLVQWLRTSFTSVFVNLFINMIFLPSHLLIDSLCFLQAPVIQCDQALTTAVRKDLAMALRDLMQHGLMEVRFNWKDLANVTLMKTIFVGEM